MVCIIFVCRCLLCSFSFFMCMLLCCFVVVSSSNNNMCKKNILFSPQHIGDRFTAVHIVGPFKRDLPAGHRAKNQHNDGPYSQERESQKSNYITKLSGLPYYKEKGENSDWHCRAAQCWKIFFIQRYDELNFSRSG